MLEDCKKCVPDHIVTYLNEQNVDMLSAPAVLADEYVHKSAFVPTTSILCSLKASQNENIESDNGKGNVSTVESLDMSSPTASH